MNRNRQFFYISEPIYIYTIKAENPYLSMDTPINLS